MFIQNEYTAMTFKMHKSHVNNFKTSKLFSPDIIQQNLYTMMNYESEKSFEDEICSMQSKE